MLAMAIGVVLVFFSYRVIHQSVTRPLSKLVVWEIVNLVQLAAVEPEAQLAPAIEDSSVFDITVESTHLNVTVSYRPLYSQRFYLHTIATLKADLAKRHDQSFAFSLALSDSRWLNFSVLAHNQWQWFLLLTQLVFFLMILGLLFISAYLFYKLYKITAATQSIAQSIGIPDSPHYYDSIVRGIDRSFQSLIKRIIDLLNTRKRLMAAISHDLRTPLMRIKLRMEKISEKTIANKTDADIAEMEQMITRMISFTKMTENTQQAIDIDSVISVICEDYQEMGVTIHYHREEGERLLLKGTSSIFKRILYNLIANAKKFTDNIAIELSQCHQQVRLTVTDDGPGVAAADMKKVFQPYFQSAGPVARADGSAGLGLAIVYELVHATAGEIHLENVAPSGLRVVMVWPRAK